MQRGITKCDTPLNYRVIKYTKTSEQFLKKKWTTGHKLWPVFRIERSRILRCQIGTSNYYKCTSYSPRIITGKIIKKNLSQIVINSFINNIIFENQPKMYIMTEEIPPILYRGDQDSGNVRYLRDQARFGHLFTNLINNGDPFAIFTHNLTQ